jgi:hypothetical protein
MCTIINERYQSALKRNANEIGRALLELKALESLEQADTYHSMDFISLSYDALFNDYIAHAISYSWFRSFWSGETPDTSIFSIKPANQGH